MRVKIELDDLDIKLLRRFLEDYEKLAAKEDGDIDAFRQRRIRIFKQLLLTPKELK